MLGIKTKIKRKWGRDGVVGIMTHYELEGPGIESRWGRDFPHLSRPTPRPTQPPVQWVPGYSRGKGGRGVVLTTPPPSSVPRFTKKGRAITLFSVRGPHGGPSLLQDKSFDN
jgi:hypothetical protein